MTGFGLIGCGRISDRHIASLAKCEHAQLAALCDVRVESMEGMERQYRQLSGSVSQIAKYANVADLLQDARVQVVIVATPSVLHAELAKQAMAQGKHVILEKPMALSLQDADELIKLAELHQVLLQVCHQLRYKPVMKQIKELINAGAMGKLYLGVISLRLQRSKAYYEAAKWRGTWDQDGGMLLNQGIHLVDLLQWFMGDYERVFGQMLRGALLKQTEDVAAGVVTFKSGAIGMIEANTLTYPSNYDNSITLFGDKATISIGGIGLNEIRKWSFDDPTLVAPDQHQAADEHFLMYKNVIEALEGNTSSMVIQASEAKKALEMIFALYDSVRTHQAAVLPLSSFSTAMMANMEGWQ